MQRSALLHNTSLTLTAVVRDEEDHDVLPARKALAFRAIGGQLLEEVTVEMPRFGYEKGLVQEAHGPDFEVSCWAALSRATNDMRRRGWPAEMPRSYFWWCADSLPVVVTAKYTSGGQPQESRGLYAIHFGLLLRDPDSNRVLPEISHITFERRLGALEASWRVLEGEWKSRRFRWEDQ